eukprot:CAMPEP_0194374882 /NCGR_PEP_ID=MMETSP0174-20130528/23354_1 /TAXON_ID=216777 /ORGANISM="Proboscia alata, Strain PI-D3" /LENGTH=176 /DNA_ID=CAMNT_0039154747 /DNA_START=150 /DNA_END=680 /DNA_ORIENTATION=-
MRSILPRIIVSIGFIFLSIAENIENEDFFTACSSGDVELVSKFISGGIVTANTKTKDGETCLHLAAIPGSVSLTRFLLEKGADPNARSTFSEGLRMHPLSWNVYGGHFENVVLLLEGGAEINADFDYIVGADAETKKVTVLDIAEQVVDDGRDGFQQTYELLVSKGGKKWVDLDKV